MSKVALFATNFLPYSQTFIYDQIRNHQAYSVEVFARKRMCSDRFPAEQIQVHLAGPLYPITRRESRFDAVLDNGNFSVIHAHFGTGAVYALPFARRHRLPMVVSFHGHDVTRLYSLERLKPKNWRYALLGSQILNHMTLGLCASRELLELLIELGVPEQRLRLQHLGVDVDAYEPCNHGISDDETLNILMIGRFVPKKGFRYGIRAFEKVARAFPRAMLTLIGSGHQEALLKSIVAALGLENRVQFTGALPPAEVRALLSKSHILLAPSVVDAMGDRESGLIVVKEASASGVIPVGTYHGGIPEIIDDGKTGFLVCERDVDALAQRLETLVANQALRSSMAAAARDKMHRMYDNRECTRLLEQHYDEARALFSA